jgi:hypothetical protein
LESQLQQLRDNIEQKQLRIDTLSSENATLAHQLRSSVSFLSSPPVVHISLLEKSRSRGEAQLEMAVPFSSRKGASRGLLDGELDDNDKFSGRITPLMALAPSLAISESWGAQKIVVAARTLDNFS